MSIRIIAKGTRLYKREELTGLEVELHGEEKAFYLKEIGAIDQGKGDGQRIGNLHRDYCECEECVKGTDKDTEDRYRNGYSAALGKWESCETCESIGWLDGATKPCPSCEGRGYNRS